jgi:hypothetical protein
MLLLDTMASRCSTAAMRNDFNAKTGLAVACAGTVANARASRHPHVEGVIHRSGQEIVPCSSSHRARLHDSPPRYFPGASCWPSPKKASRASSTPRASCWPPRYLVPAAEPQSKNELLAFGRRPEAELVMFSSRTSASPAPAKPGRTTARPARRIPAPDAAARHDHDAQR